MIKKNTAGIVYAAELTSTSQALLALISQHVKLDPYRPKLDPEPRRPNGHDDAQAALRDVARAIRSGLGSLASTPGPSQATNFEADVLNSLRSALGEALLGKRVPFDNLSASLLYLKEHEVWSRRRHGELRMAKGAADASLESLHRIVDQLAGILRMREELGAEAVSDAAAAPNKSIAAVALQMAAQEQAKKVEPLQAGIFDAARGLMLLQAAGIDSEALTHETLEQAVATALLSIYQGNPDQTATAFICGRAVSTLSGVAYRLEERRTSAGLSMVRTAVIAAGTTQALASATQSLSEAAESRSPSKQPLSPEQQLAKLRQQPYAPQV